MCCGSPPAEANQGPGPGGIPAAAAAAAAALSSACGAKPAGAWGGALPTNMFMLNMAAVLLLLLLLLGTGPMPAEAPKGGMPGQ